MTTTSGPPTQDQWRELFAEVPGSMGALLQGLFVIVDAERAPRRGQAVPRERTAQELHDLLHPQFSDLPFAESVRPLLKPSLRAVAERAGMNPGYFTRLVSGERELDRYTLERIAAAARVDPGYFLEYRQMFVADMVSRQVARNAPVGIAAYKALARASR